MRRFTSLFLVIVAVVLTSAFLVEDSSTETVHLQITSSNPDSVIVFRSVVSGTWNGAAPADLQKTPFELEVAPNNFYGAFQKVTGGAEMQIALIAEENGERRWEHTKAFEQLSLITLGPGSMKVSGH